MRIILCSIQGDCSSQSVLSAHEQNVPLLIQFLHAASRRLNSPVNDFSSNAVLAFFETLLMAPLLPASADAAERVVVEDTIMMMTTTMMVFATNEKDNLIRE